MAGNLKGVAEEGEDRSGEEEASATTYFFSPDSCPTIGEAPPNSDQTKVRKSVKFKKRKSIKEIVAHRRKNGGTNTFSHISIVSWGELII